MAVLIVMMVINLRILFRVSLLSYHYTDVMIVMVMGIVILVAMIRCYFNQTCSVYKISLPQEQFTPPLLQHALFSHFTLHLAYPTP